MTVGLTASCAGLLDLDSTMSGGPELVEAGGSHPPRDDSAADGSTGDSVDKLDAARSCLGTMPLWPNEGGNAANVAQGGGISMTTNCGVVAEAEMPIHAFDNDISTKWFCAPRDFAWPTIEYRFASDATYAVNAYTITSANALPSRDPQGWRMEGSNDGAVWNLVDERHNQLFANRFQTNGYVFSNCTPYSRYRFVVTELLGGDAWTWRLFQVAEIQLFGPQGRPPSLPPNQARGGTVTTTAACVQVPDATPKEAFDGDFSSAWFCGANAAPSIEIALSASRAIAAYSVTSGRDFPDRDPKNWKLEGTNDVTGATAGTWTTLDTQTEQVFTARAQTILYSFANSAAFTRYRFFVTANNGSSDFQVAEIMLFGD
jgi:alpha-L-fucosidase 2